VYRDAFYPGGGYDAAARRAEKDKERVTAVRERDRKYREALKEKEKEHDPGCAESPSRYETLPGKRNLKSS
jgi:hypothetical protein